MKRFVFYTSRFEADANRHGAMNAYKRFKDKVENHNFEHQLRNEYTTIRDGHRYVRDRHQNLRAVYEYREERIANNEVGIYVALRDFKHDADYEKFYKSTTENAIRDSLTGVNDVDWNYLKQKVAANLISMDETFELNSLNESERLFIDDSKSINHDIMPEWVYESNVWKDQMMTEKYQSVHIDIVRTLNDFFYKAIVNEEANQIHSIPLHKEGYYIIARKDNTSFFLLELGGEDIKNKWEDKSLDWLRHNSRRGYPCSILDDPDEWYKMEQDENSNFILSDEERDIIMSQSEYPLFISGRAGSGKSTVLQYMFAELLLRYIKIRKISTKDLLPPIYLSYSKNLVINAQRLAKSLFKHNNVYQRVLKEEGLTFENDVEPLLQTCFRVFGDIVRECIEAKNPDITNKRFASSKHISFVKFITAWDKHFGRNPLGLKDIGPSVSWHVINTYIKGWDSSDYLTSDDYEGLSRDDKSVSQSVYKEVYDKVWPWYKEYCEENELWDDLDLVRYSLSPDDDSEETYVAEHYSGVFCDEAQDFTRTQIDFILQLSSFFNRSLKENHSDIFKLPFVFAGDEFQTLNPTGFRWDVLRSYFMDTLSKSCDVNNVSAPKPRQLSENYRSVGPIVKLGNRFQLLRESRFGMTSNPQTEHFLTNAAPVLCLPANNDDVWKQLKAKNAILIVPAPEGMTKQDYIKRTPIRDKISFDRNGISEGITILTPAQAKGLEYPCVAIYGFDEDPLHTKVSLRGLIRWFENRVPNRIEKHDEENMALKYLVSNAYVAITRARKNLYILDSFNADSFWSFAFSFHNDDMKKEEERLQELMLQSLTDSRRLHWHTNDLGYIGEGTTEHDIYAGNMSFSDIKNSLEDMEITALNSADYEMLMQVSSRYRERGYKQDAARCTAEAYQIQERYYEAGKEFVNAKEGNKAIECYWKVIEQEGTIKAISSCETSDYSVLVDACKRIMSRHCSLQDMSKVFDYIVRKPEKAIINKDDVSSWLFIIRNMLKLITPNEHAQKEIANSFLLQYGKLCDSDVEFNEAEDIREIIARIAYNEGFHEKAMGYWERCQNKPVEYYKERLKTAQYPEKLAIIRAINDSGWKEKILVEYRKNFNVALNSSDLETLMEAIMDKGTVDDFKQVFVDLLLRARTLEQANEVLRKASMKHVVYNSIVMRGLIEAKYTDLRDWNVSSHEISDNGLRQAIKMVSDLKRIRNQKFDNELPTGSDRAIREFMSRNFCNYSNSLWLIPIIVEIGRKYENKHRFVDTLSFYEWALGQSILRGNRNIRLRWIYNKEQKGDTEEARQRRKQWGFPETGDLSIIEDYTPWKSIFQEAILLPEQDRKQEQESISTKEDKQDKSEKKVPEKSITKLNTEDNVKVLNSTDSLTSNTELMLKLSTLQKENESLKETIKLLKEQIKDKDMIIELLKEKK